MEDSAGEEPTTAATATLTDDLYQSEAYLDALEDVHTRFLLNLPESELQTADRIFFQLEQAWWFYEDWICDQQPQVPRPRFATLKPFAQRLFAYSPLLPDPKQFSTMWNEFTQYKRKISNYGCILLTADCKQLVLCQVWNGKTYTFPAGKINQGENGATAAARETYEETGFDPACTFGLTAQWKAQEPHKITWKHAMNDEQDALVFQEDNGKRRTCYVVVGVPEDFPFEPVARKEVSKVAWYPLDHVPKPSYAVLPFLPQLRKWIKKYKDRTGTKTPTPSRDRSNKRPHNRKKEQRTTPKRGERTNSRGRNSSSSRQRQQNHVASDDDDVVLAGLASAGEAKRWTEEEMFQANERILGRKIDYDGNPHMFAEQGFAGGRDPHAFHVVGGSFLNSTESGSSTTPISKLAPPPQASKLQPLFRKTNNDDVDDDDDDGGDHVDNKNKNAGSLTPFFSSDGATPWGEVVEECKTSPQQQKSYFVLGEQQQQPKNTKNANDATSKNGPANAAEDENVSRALFSLLDSASGGGGNGGDDNGDARPRSRMSGVSSGQEDPPKRKKHRRRKRPMRKSGDGSKNDDDHDDDDGGEDEDEPSNSKNDEDDDALLFLTDAEITAKSQAEKLRQLGRQQQQQEHSQRQEQLQEKRMARKLQYEKDMLYIRQWVENLPKPKPTKHFGKEFRFDVDAILDAIYSAKKQPSTSKT